MKPAEAASTAAARLRGREAFVDGFHRPIVGFASAGLDFPVEHVVEKASWRTDLAGSLPWAGDV